MGLRCAAARSRDHTPHGRSKATERSYRSELRSTAGTDIAGALVTEPHGSFVEDVSTQGADSEGERPVGNRSAGGGSVEDENDIMWIIGETGSWDNAA